MARPKQPIDLMQAKRRVHRAKEEQEERKAREVRAPCDDIIAPLFLHKKQREDFDKIAGELAHLGIMSNLDCDALARYIVARDSYVKFTRIVNGVAAKAENLGLLDRATAVQDRAFKQCRSSAADLGLTITSRCRLVLPKPEKQSDPNAELFGDMVVTA